MGRDWKIEFDTFFIDEEGIRLLDDSGPGTYEPKELTVSPRIAHILMHSKVLRIHKPPEVMSRLLDTYIAGQMGNVVIKIDSYLPDDQVIVVRPSVVTITLSGLKE